MTTLWYHTEDISDCCILTTSSAKSLYVLHCKQLHNIEANTNIYTDTTYTEQDRMTASCTGLWGTHQATWMGRWEFHICTTARRSSSNEQNV